MKSKFLLLVVCLMIFLSGCTNIRSQIAYTVYPVGYILQRIGGADYTYVSIQNDEIIQRATLKENYEEILRNSEILFNVGKLEPYMTVANESISKSAKSVMDLSSLNAIYTFQRYTPIVNDGEITYIEGPYYRGSEFDNIDTNNKDLSLWIDPIAMLSMSKDIMEWMIETYPEDEELFRNNYKQLETDLVRLDAEYQSFSTKFLKDNKEIKMVTMTSSFGNWQKTYGIQVYPVILSKFGSLPSEAQLELIKTRIINDNVQYIVYEPNMSDDMKELFNSIKDELKLTKVELSNLSSLTENQKNNGYDYLSVMYENLQSLEIMTTNPINKE